MDRFRDLIAPGILTADYADYADAEKFKSLGRSVSVVTSAAEFKMIRPISVIRGPLLIQRTIFKIRLL